MRPGAGRERCGRSAASMIPVLTREMRLPYPKSFLGLLVAGFALVTTPFLIGLSTSAFYTGRLSDIGRSALYQAVQVTQASRRIADLLRELERSARQALILGEGGVPEPYAALRKELAASAVRLTELPFDAAQRAALDQIRALEQEVFDALSAGPNNAGALESVIPHFAAASAAAAEIIRRGDQLIERESERMHAIAQRAQQVLFWQFAAAIPLAIIVIAGFTVMLARPVRALDRAIGRIGAGDLAVPVEVAGPRDLEQLGRRLEWLRCELLGLEQQKNRFLRHVSHALKTPLAAVREGSELMIERFSGNLTATQSELLAILHRNGLELQRLVEDLLHLGEAQFRRMHLDLDIVALDVLIEAVRAGHELTARAKALRFEVKLEPQATRFIADRDKVQVIMDNLLSNAIKHAPAGSTVEIFAKRQGDQVTIGVHDQGSGIAPEDRERVFDPFYQGRSSGSAVVKGSGVGLSIVREYALAHGGSASVGDDPRGGAQLCVSLPIANAPQRLRA